MANEGLTPIDVFFKRFMAPLVYGSHNKPPTFADGTGGPSARMPYYPPPVLPKVADTRAYKAGVPEAIGYFAQYQPLTMTEQLQEAALANKQSQAGNEQALSDILATRQNIFQRTLNRLNGQR